MPPVKGIWLLLRSHAAITYLAAVAVVIGAGSALGPDSRTVITRDGATGEPLPFVLAMTGVVAMVCLVDPAPELTTTMPRPAWQLRAAQASFVAGVSLASVALSSVVAPGLAAATARNVLLALTVAFIVALWHPSVSWVPTSIYLALSWFYGTATYDDGVRAWAIPAQGPDWLTAAVWVVIAFTAASLWTLGLPAVRSRQVSRAGTVRQRLR